MAAKISFFFLLLSFWLLISGHYTVFMITLGIVSLSGVLLLSGRMDMLNQGLHTWRFYMRLPSYSFWLLWQIIQSNLDVAWRILHPKLPINPGFIRVPLSQKKDLAKLVHANSISLTPGTVSTDINESSIEVHVLTRQPNDSAEHQELDDRVCRLEGSD